VIKRPLNARFREKVLSGVKCTTIRDNPWPHGQLIMLYSWSGKAYRSKHMDCAVVKVVGSGPIMIRRDEDSMIFSPDSLAGTPLWQCEGFDSQEDMDTWFRGKMKPGDCVEKALMLFMLEGRDA
jgi:hypothetical protein